MKRVEVDPRGDVALQVPCPPPYSLVLVVPASETASGNPQDEVHTTINEGARDTRDLIVSSKVLSVASPVFKAMFTGEFCEGVSLAAKTGPAPFQLPLPDDDADAMLLFCKLLHFAVDDIPDLPNTELLCQLAVICDKYQCTSVLKHSGVCWARNWLQEFDKATPQMEQLSHLFLFTYVADLATEFSEVAWRVLLQHKGPFIGPDSQVSILLDHPLLPQELIERLDSKRHELCNAFHTAMMAPLTSWTWGSMMQGCLRAATTIARYTQALRDAGLFPYDLKFSNHQFQELLDGVDRLGFIAVPPCPINKRSCGFCHADSTDNLVNVLLSVVHSIRKGQKWYSCLDCAKSGDHGVSTSAGEDQKMTACRIEHKPVLEIKDRCQSVQLDVAAVTNPTTTVSRRR